MNKFIAVLFVVLISTPLIRKLFKSTSDATSAYIGSAVILYGVSFFVWLLYGILQSLFD